jgi:hypothetical protein
VWKFNTWNILEDVCVFSHFITLCQIRELEKRTGRDMKGSMMSCTRLLEAMMDVASYKTKESLMNVQFHYFLLVAFRLRKTGRKTKAVGNGTTVKLRCRGRNRV